MTEEEFREAKTQYGDGSFEAEMGAEAVRKLLVGLDLVKLSDELRQNLVETNSKQKKKDFINRLKIVEAIRDSDNKPEWMDRMPMPDPMHLGYDETASEDAWRRMLGFFAEHLPPRPTRAGS